jgi:hypothetical protein
MAKGKARFTKRDLKLAREIAKPGDNVEARPDGTIVIVTGKAGDALSPPVQPNGSANEGDWDNI